MKFASKKWKWRRVPHTQGDSKGCEFMHCKVVLLESWRTKLRVYATLESRMAKQSLRKADFLVAN